MPYRDQVDAEPVRRHVQALVDGGMSVPQIQFASGVNRTTIAVLLGTAPGRKPSAAVRAETAGRLLRVKLDRGSTIDGLVPAAGTRRRLQALQAIGWPGSELARRLGLSGDVNGPQCARSGQVRAATAEKVTELYRELADTPGPSQRTRATALGKGWLPPLWWDDDIIDDPLAEPEGIRQYRQGGRVLVDDVTAPRADRVSLLLATGYSPAEIAERIGTTLRYVLRDMLERPGFGCPGCRNRFETRSALISHARARHHLELPGAGGAAEAPEIIDEIAVARLMAGTLAVPLHTYSPELVEAVRRLAARGLDDTEIGDRVRRGADAVLKIRHRNAIPTPPRESARGTAQQIDGIAARPGASGAATTHTPEGQPAA